MSHAPYEPVPQAPPQWAQQPVQPGRAPSRLLPLLGVVLGSLGLIAGVAAWFRAAPSTEGASAVYSEQQVSEAKKAVCETFSEGMASLQAAGSKKPDNPADALPITAVNVRLAEVAFSNALFNSLNRNAATPKDLRDLTSQLAGIYQKIALIQLADGARADFHPVAAEADEIVPKIKQICL